MKEAKTILKASRLSRTNWGKKIIKAEEQAWFPEEDIKQAANWTTCACGSLDRSLFMKNASNGPRDGKLNKLGMLFYEHVSYNDFVGAAHTLQEIQDRSIKLLNRTRKKTDNV